MRPRATHLLARRRPLCMEAVACRSMRSSPFFSRPRPPHELQRWFKQVAADVAVDYETLHAEAVANPQKSGHGGESTWLRLLRDWLPPGYDVAARKYIIPETDQQPFETDIVVFNPGYPERLRERGGDSRRRRRRGLQRQANARRVRTS